MGTLDSANGLSQPAPTDTPTLARSTFEMIKESCELPTPDGIVLKILHLTSDPDATLTAITRAVESDPAIASQLIKYVNTPRAGLPRKVTSVQSAVALLGMTTVRSITLGFSLVSKGTRACKGFEGSAFWSECLARASACRLVAGKCPGLTSDELFTCGLLSQVGRLAFACVFPKAYAEVLDSVDTSDFHALAATERHAFEIDHVDLSAEMMTDWGLPDTFTNAVRTQLATELDSNAPGLAGALRFAAPLSILLTRSLTRRATVRRMVISATQAGVTPDYVTEVFDLIIQDWLSMSTVFSLPSRRVPTLNEMYMRAH